MTVLQIVQSPDKILEEKCDRVTVFDKKLAKLLDNMYETMVEADGVGIAAPQVGVKQQVAVIELEEDILEMINPEMLEMEGEQTEIEGCLSFPGVYGEVKRAYRVKIRAQDRDGQYYELEAEDYYATAIQHEYDHLQGVLFTSKITRYVSEEELEGYEEE